MGIGGFGSGDDFFVRRIEVAVEDVLPDRSVEKHRFLRDQADLLAQGREGDVADVNAIDGQTAARDIVETGQQVGDRRFAGTAGADEGDDFARGDFQIEIGKGRVVFVIGKGDMVEFDFPFDRRQDDGVRLFLDIRFGVDCFKDAVGSGQGFLDIAVDFTDSADRVGQVDGVDEEGDEGAGRHFAVDDAHAAVPDDARDSDGCEELDERRQQGRQFGRRHESPEVAVVLDHEAADFKVLPVEGADDADPRNSLFQKRRNVSHLALDVMAGPAQAGAEEVDRKDDEGDDNQGQQGQLPVEEEHGPQGADEDDRFLDEGNEVACNGRLQSRDVIGQVAHDIARLVLVEVRQGQGLQVTIQGFADIVDDFLANETHEVFLAEIEEPAEQEEDQDTDDDEVQRVDILIGQDLIDDVLDEPRDDDVARPGQGHTDDGDDEAHLVRLDEH